MYHLTRPETMNTYSNGDGTDSPKTPGSSRSDLHSDVRGQDKLFNDPIHDHFRLEPVSCSLIDTRPFQRLRGLKQLGCCEYVYPGATHSRFQHSLGVGYLAGLWSKRLLSAERYPHEELERFSEIVEVAGLCHDLGHGPFSHAWEHRILPSLGLTTWRHEEMSKELVNIVFEDALIEDRFDWTRRDRQIVQELILGKKDSCNNLGYGEFPRFLFDIVNNQSNGLDVDKFDYLPRDSYHTKVKIQAPYDRLLHFAKVDGDCISYRVSEESSLREVYSDRTKLHRVVYCHKTTRAIELMIADAVKEVGSEFQLIDMSRSPNEFLKLDDSFIKYVRDWYGVSSSGARKAKTILNRITRRQLYKLCGEVQIPQDLIPSVKDRVTEQDIVSHQSCDQVDLRPDDIHVTTVYIDRGLKDRDPIGQTSFYKGRCHEHIMIENTVETCHQMWLRVYCKDDRHEEATRKAFKNWSKSCLRSMNVHTPEKTNPRIDTDETMLD